jgi:UDP-3-O-[3-hydroxymyristoyl] glucosamine N-acyltransferase
MKLEDLISFINPINFIKNFSIEICGLDNVFESSFNSSNLGWLSDKNAEKVESIHKGSIIISKNTFDKYQTILSTNVNWIIVENPRKSFAEIIEHFYVPKKEFGSIHPSSVISSSISFNSQYVTIGPNVVLEEDIEIGDFVEIGANTVIKKGTKIGHQVTIGSNCTIGGVGFGYEKNDDGDYKVIHHIGNVLISEGVEIGNNVCIDRAVMGSTFIGKNVKIDNLVHIAHGVKIQENSLIIANAMIGGSVTIGKNVWVSPSTSIRQKLTVDDNSLIGMGSVVVKDVSYDDIVAGVPAKSIKK